MGPNKAFAKANRAIAGKSLKIHGDKIQPVQQQKYWQQNSREFKGLVMNGTRNLHQRLSKLESQLSNMQSQHYTPKSAKQEKLKQ